MEKYSTIILIVVFVGLCIVRLGSNSKLINWGSKAGIYGILILIINYFIPQYAVAWNLITVGFVTLLGGPGMMTLYMIRILG